MADGQPSRSGAFRGVGKSGNEGDGREGTAIEPWPKRILIVLGILFIAAGCLLLKASTPSPHGWIEIFFALPLMSAGSFLLSAGLFQIRRVLSVAAALFALVFSIACFTPLWLAAAIVFDDLDQAPGASPITYPLKLLFGMRDFLLRPFLDEPVVVEGKLYAWIDPPPDAESRALLEGTILPSDRRLEPLENVEVSIWTGDRYREYLECQKSLVTKGACLGPPSPNEWDLSDENGRYRLDVLIPIGPSTLTAEKDGCRPAVGEVQEHMKSGLYAASFILVCDSLDHTSEET